MTKRTLMAVLAVTFLAGWGPNDPTGDIAIPENVGATGVTFLDDIAVCWGTGCKYWLIYNSTTDTFKLWSTDIDGAGTDGELQIWDDGTDDLLLKGALDGFPATTDALPLVLSLGGADSWAQATGANQVGGALYIAGGIGTRQIVCSDRTLTDTDTVTLTVDGAATVLTESTDFDCEGEASEEACCDNLGTAITTAAIGITPDCDTTAGTCYLTPAARLITVDLAIADGGVNGTGWTLTEGTDGAVVADSSMTVTGNLTVNGTSDLESYTAIGNGSAPNADRTLLVDRDFSSSAAGAYQISTTGTITMTGGTGEVFHNSVQPSGTVINSGNAHANIYSAIFFEPAITLSSGTCTAGGVMVVGPAPTECGVNRSLYIQGDTSIDKTGTDTNSPTFELSGDNSGNEVASSFFTAYGAQPYLVVQVDDDGTTPTPVQVLHIDDNSIRPGSAGGIAAGSASNYFSDVIGAELSCMDTDVSNQLSIDWNEDDSSDRAFNIAVNSGDRTLDMSANLTVEAASTVNQDLTTDAAVDFDSLTLATGPMSVESDANGYCAGAGGCNDEKQYFDGTNYRFQCPGCTNGFVFDAPPIFGPIVHKDPQTLVGVIDVTASGTCADNTVFGPVIQTDSTTHLTMYAQCDGAGGADNRRIGINESLPETTIEVVDTAPYLSMTNSTAEDSDGGRESRLIFQGTQSGSEETHLAWIEASHSGASDDEKGQLKFYLNDTNDGDTPTLQMTINETGRIIVPSFTVDYVMTSGSASLGPTAPGYGDNGSCQGLAFDADAENVHLYFEVPDCYADGASDDLVLNIYWCAESGVDPADTETVIFDITYRTVVWNTDDINGVSASTETTGTVTYTQSGAGDADDSHISTITLDADDANNPINPGSTLAIHFDRDFGGDTYASDTIVAFWEIAVPQTALKCDHN